MTPPPPPLTIPVASQAERTLIIGGILKNGFVDPENVEDKGTKTTVVGFS
jgi:hypothetical protein